VEISTKNSGFLLKKLRAARKIAIDPAVSPAFWHKMGRSLML